MSIVDYATLKTTVSDWSHRSDLAPYLDDFIKFAEEKLASDLRVRELETSTTGTLSGITLALPADFAELRRLTIATPTQYTPENIGADGLKAKYQQGSGLPSFYAIVGSNIEFNVSPDSAYTYVMDYWKKPPAITSTSTTSDVLTAHPGVYLFACLTEVGLFAKNNADIERYEGKYKQYVSFANARSRNRGGPMRVVSA